MNIFTYPKARDIPEKYMQSLIQAQIECWGSKPFSEYKICKNDECKGIYSLEEIQENTQESMLSQSHNTFLCVDCGEATEYMYNPKEFREVIMEYIQGKVSALLVVSDAEQVEGFGVIKQTTIEEVIENEFQTRPESYHTDFKKDLSRAVFHDEKSFGEDIICFQQIYVSPKVRTTQLTFSLLQELFLLHPEYENIPVIGETRFDCDFYPITRSIGFSDIIADKYGYVIQSIKKHGDVSEFLEEYSSFRDMFSFIKFYKTYSKDILKNNPRYTGRRYYVS